MYIRQYDDDKIMSIFYLGPIVRQIHRLPFERIIVERWVSWHAKPTHTHTDKPRWAGELAELIELTEMFGWNFQLILDWLTWIVERTFRPTWVSKWLLNGDWRRAFVWFSCHLECDITFCLDFSASAEPHRNSLSQKAQTHSHTDKADDGCIKDDPH